MQFIGNLGGEVEVEVEVILGLGNLSHEDSIVHSFICFSVNSYRYKLSYGNVLKVELLSVEDI